MARHTLTYYANRSTPRVTTTGAKAAHKKGEGSVVKRRQATAAEERQIRKGVWIRTRHNGLSPNHPKARSSGLKGRPRLKKR